MDSIQTVVIGAGVVGLAVARRLALAGREVLILEAAESFAGGTTSRNSEVIHAGIYYAPDSLKAKLCRPGRDALYRFCASHGVAHERIGKLIVATSAAEVPTLQTLAERARGNGVTDLRFLERESLARLEPALAATAALLSPSTGIIDSHGLCLALLGAAEAAGAQLACRSPLEAARALAEGFELTVGGAETMTLRCRELVNAGGLAAPLIAGRIEGLAPSLVPEARYAKGNYFALEGRPPFSHLIYPVPVPGGLGTHLTLDLAGRGRFGPDVEWVERPDYRVDPARAAGFYGSIRRWWPGLPDGALRPDFAGIRPKLALPEGQPDDFVIQGPAEHGVPGLVNLLGIESPGLTSSLALAGEVAWRLGAIHDPADLQA